MSSSLSDNSQVAEAQKLVSRIGFYRKLADVPDVNVNMFFDYYWSENKTDKTRLVLEIGDKNTYLSKDEAETLVAELMEALNTWDEIATEMGTMYDVADFSVTPAPDFNLTVESEVN